MHKLKLDSERKLMGPNAQSQGYRPGVPLKAYDS